MKRQPAGGSARETQPSPSYLSGLSSSMRRQLFSIHIAGNEGPHEPFAAAARESRRAVADAAEDAAEDAAAAGSMPSLWGALNASPPTPRRTRAAAAPTTAGSAKTSSAGITPREERGALAAEVARLRVQCAALAAENDQLRHQVANAEVAAKEAAERARTPAPAQSRERAVEDGSAAAATAGRLAAAEARETRLRERADRQKHALETLSATASKVADENDRVKKELQLATRTAAEAEQRAVRLERRLVAVQKLYLAGGVGITSTVSVQGGAKSADAALADPALTRALRLLTPDVLAASAPPAEFPASPSDLGALPLKSRNAAGPRAGAPVAVLRRREKQLVEEAKEKEAELRALAKQVSDLEQQLERTRAGAAKSARERRDLEATYATRLAGAARRIRWLLEREASWRAGLKQAEEYAWQLERRLLHLTQAQAQGRPASSKTQAHVEREGAPAPERAIDEARRASADETSSMPDVLSGAGPLDPQTTTGDDDASSMATADKELVARLSNSLDALDSAEAAADASSDKTSPARQPEPLDPFGTPYPEVDIAMAERRAAKGAAEDADAALEGGDGVGEAELLIDRLNRLSSDE